MRGQCSLSRFSSPHYLDRLRDTLADNCVLVTNRPPLLDRRANADDVVAYLCDSLRPFSNLRHNICLASANQTSCALWLHLTGRCDGEWMGERPADDRRNFSCDAMMFYDFAPNGRVGLQAGPSAIVTPFSVVRVVHLINKCTKAIELGIENPQIFARGSVARINLAELRKSVAVHFHPHPAHGTQAHSSA